MLMKLNKNKFMKKILLIIVIAIAVILVLLLRRPPAELPEAVGPALSEEDTTAVIEKELQATDFGDVEAEMKALEEDLKSL
jgi:hypothetical protein